MSAPLHVDSVKATRWEAGEIRANRRRLGVAAGAVRLGVAIIDIDPGARSTPPHSHADEEEIFLVLKGSGISWQSGGSNDVRCYEIAEGDVLVHSCSGDAHTLIAGDEGLSVLVLAEGSRTDITYMPRTKMFWLGPRWSPADAPPPFTADAALGPLPLAEPTAERPGSIVATDDCERITGERGRFAHDYRNPGAEAGAERLVLSVDNTPPGKRNCPLHWHTAREECFYIVSGSGTVTIGDDQFPLTPGTFFLRPPNTGVPHAIDAGPDGLHYVTMGDLLPGDICVYPESKKVQLGKGLFVRAEPLDYFDGEPEADTTLL